MTKFKKGDKVIVVSDGADKVTHFIKLGTEAKIQNVHDNGYLEIIGVDEIGNSLWQTVSEDCIQLITNKKQKSMTSTKRGLVKGSATALAAGKKAAATRAANKTGNMTGNKITRLKALDLMKSNKGRFFTVTFKKQDGSMRKLNGQFLKDQKDSSLGYVLMKESGKLKTSPNDCIRNVNLQTLQSITVGGTVYSVK